MVLSVNLVSLYHRREGSYGTCSFMALWLIYIMAFLSHMIYIRFLLSIDKRLERFHTFTAWWVFRFLMIVNEYSYKKKKIQKNQILESRIGKLLRLFTLSSSFEISLLSCFIIQLNEQLRQFSQLASEKKLKIAKFLISRNSSLQTLENAFKCFIKLFVIQSNQQFSQIQYSCSLPM